jgi:transcriptional regulator GlxA family with amidase domain
MKILFFIFEGITALDVVGPYEVLSRLPSAEAVFVGKKKGVIRTDDGILGLQADLGFDDVDRADLLLVPGGFGTRALEGDGATLDWLRAVDRHTTITASVCTGALLLGAAGFLKGRRANTHWAVRHRLAEFGSEPVADRIVSDGKYRTAAGMSAGIDLALSMVAELSSKEVAQAIQLGIEYDPDPPFNAGSPDKAPKHLVDAVRARVLARERGATQP